MKNTLEIYSRLSRIFTRIFARAFTRGFARAFTMKNYSYFCSRFSLYICSRFCSCFYSAYRVLRINIIMNKKATITELLTILLLY